MIREVVAVGAGGLARGVWPGGVGNRWLSSACSDSGVGEKEQGEDFARLPHRTVPKAGAAVCVGVECVGSGLIGGRRGGQPGADHI